MKSELHFLGKYLLIETTRFHGFTKVDCSEMLVIFVRDNE
jgi:hypothetical protein